MYKNTRIKKIQEIIDREKHNPFNIVEIPWEDDLKSMNVYKIPLHLLVYNKYNGRILSRTKSLEKQNKNIDEFSDEGKKLIEHLLWESNPERNKNTKKSIATSGQQKIGIITRDGIIIDGNRRVMLLNDMQNGGRLFSKYNEKKYDYFKAVVLPVSLEENPLEIEKLETSFQMGEDQKLGYNATEKYLKASELYKRINPEKQYRSDDYNKSTISKIAEWMGEDDSEVVKYLNTMLIMDEYLYYLGYDGIYTQLDGREDQFLFLTKWLNLFYGENSKKAFDGYADSDVDDLKELAFDYIRIKNNYDGKEFRNLADGMRENHFFGDKDIWERFFYEHQKIKTSIGEEPEIDFNSNNLSKHLDDRDNQYFRKSKLGNETSAFLDNLFESKTRIGYNKASGAPEKLVKRAIDAFSAIKQGHQSFTNSEVQELVESLANQVTDSMVQKSITNLLKHIIHLLEPIDINNIQENEAEEVKEQTKIIQKICYKINKEL